MINLDHNIISILLNINNSIFNTSKNDNLLVKND